MGKIQLHNLFEGSTDCDDKLEELKQLLGKPLPIRQHLEEMIVHYQNSGILLEEVALALIVRHYDELYLPKDKKIIADKLIRESRAKLQNYWERYGQLLKDYDRLQNDYLQAKDEYENLKNDGTFSYVTLTVIGIGLFLIWFFMFRFQLRFGF